MDPMKALDMKHRAGVSHDEIEDFTTRMDMIAQAMEDIKNDTFDPLTCNIPGYKTLEQEEMERQARVQREEARRKQKEEELRKEKQEEQAQWWHRANLCGAMQGGDDNDEAEESEQSKTARYGNRVLEAYKTRDVNDYSQWDQWEPQDPVSLQEQAERDAELEKVRNRNFETTNPAFCTQFKKDMEARRESQKDKQRTAERSKARGNRFYKTKQYESAIKCYKDALRASPFHVAVLANLAQCYLRLDQLDDCIEFCTRTLYVDPHHVKALSRRAAAWHKQQKLAEAAQDMQRALALDRENADIIEQHSIIVGDYEDAETTTRLATMLERAKGTRDGEPRVHQELRVAHDVLTAIDQQTGLESLEPPRIQAAWVLYDQVASFLERNADVRAFFRTSGHLKKLSDRLSLALQESKDGLGPSNESLQSTDRDSINAMLKCATAAVAHTPRNQVLLFRHETFRHELVASFQTLSLHCNEPRIQSNLVCFLDHVVASKSWKTFFLGSKDVMVSLLTALCSEPMTKDGKHDTRAYAALRLASSSLCCTLSSDLAGIDTFRRHSDKCLAALLQAFDTPSITPSSPFQLNVLGWSLNLSTNKAFRASVDTHVEKRQKFMQTLLHLTQANVKTSKQWPLAERALSVLLNLSLNETPTVRTLEVLESQAVATIETILRHVTAATFSDLVLVASRTASLVCRLHSPLDGTVEPARDHRLQPRLLAQLYALSQLATLQVNDQTRTVPDEVGQVLAQIWCHFGWCAHVPSVRARLREKEAVSHLLQGLAWVNKHKDKTHAFQAGDRVIGNMVKVLIAMQADDDPIDLQAFRKEEYLASLVQSLQTLQDGRARQNVAILLARLCQREPRIKEQVRALRGIEMMLSLSRTSQTWKSSN